MPPGVLVAGLALAEQGVPVFPCWPPAPGGGCSCVRGTACDRAAKHPVGFLVPGGLKDATTDPETLRRWWSRPERKTGRPWTVAAALPPGLVVVDVDGPDGLAGLQAGGFELPATLVSETGRQGGEHHWYSCDPPLPSGAGPVRHVDIKGHGGYVLAAPSVHVSGRRYAWRGGSFNPDLIAPAPLWLYELARPVPSAPSAPTDPERWAELLGGPVLEGARNATAAKVAGLYFRCLPASAAWPTLECWNLARCRPPLEPDELARIGASIASRELRRRGGGQ